MPYGGGLSLKIRHVGIVGTEETYLRQELRKEGFGGRAALPLTGKAAFQAARSHRVPIENWQHSRYPQRRGFCYTTRIGKLEKKQA